MPTVFGLCRALEDWSLAMRDVNAALLGLIGRNREAVLGRPLYALLAPAQDAGRVGR
jgi:hypothetical protein